MIMVRECGDSGEKTLFVPAMKKLGHDVVPFWLEENGYPDEPVKLQKNLFAFAEKEKPDLIFFILMKDEISTSTLEQLSRNFITVNWFCDDYWRFESFTRHTAPKLSYSVTVDKFSISKYKKIGYENVILSQWAAIEYVENINLKGTKFKYDISLVGSRNPAREWVVSELRKSGYKVDCFGAGWENDRVSFNCVKDIFLSSKINLNISNSVPSDLRFIAYICGSMMLSVLTFNLKNLKRSLAAAKLLITGEKKADSIKARNFEIPGCGGFQLTQYAPEIEDYYVLGKEIEAFSNLYDLKLQIDYYLENENIRNAVREAGYRRTKEYTYEKRLKQVFDKIKLNPRKT